MKTLLLIRHAKSSWDNFLLSDIDRPLNERGKQDAPMMAKRLLNRKTYIDVFISSPAKRAKQTAKAFLKEYGKSKKELILNEELYEASVKNFQNVVDTIDKKYDSAAIFSHNPGITDYVNSLTEHKLNNMPTCSVFAVTTQIRDWSEFKDAKKEFLFFDYPKVG